MTAERSRLQEIEDAISPWREPLCAASDLGYWKPPPGGCRFCDQRISQDLEELAALTRPMIVCPECGNKRCPKAAWHQNACTQSNEAGQPAPHPTAPTVDDVSYLLRHIKELAQSPGDVKNRAETLHMEEA